MATEHHERTDEGAEQLHVRAALQPVIEAVLPEGRRALSPRGSTRTRSHSARRY